MIMDPPHKKPISFFSSLPSEVTKEYYHSTTMQIDREEYDRLLDYKPRKLQSKIIDYVIWMKDEKKLSSSSLKSTSSFL